MRCLTVMAITGALYLGQAIPTRSKIEHPEISSKDAQSSIKLQKHNDAQK